MRMLAVRSNLEAHLGSRQVSRVVYGSIIGVALIVALQSHPPTPAGMIGWLIGTGVGVGVARLFNGGGGGGNSTPRPGAPPRRRAKGGGAPGGALRGALSPPVFV